MAKRCALLEPAIDNRNDSWLDLRFDSFLEIARPDHRRITDGLSCSSLPVGPTKIVIAAV